MKRCIDIVFSLCVIALFLPLALPIMVVLRFTGEGKVFYRQPRLGKGGQLFKMYKFATMLEDSPNIGPGDITLKDDPRVLPLGKFLRKFKINEVPQVINILKGEMTLVGPRPLTPRTFGMYPDDAKQQLATMVPGLTGIGSIIFRDEETIIAQSSKPFLECYRDEIAPYKGELELWYTRNQNAWVDLKIVFLTAWMVFSPQSTIYDVIFPDLPRRGGPRVAPLSQEGET
ncbi:MAG: sugar transferase [Desulfomonile tiedjei]|nr:sugar transferase [Desulfomonile tiedjei]